MNKYRKLSDTERLILKNQFAILEFLTRAFPEVAERGNTIYHDSGHYNWLQAVLDSGEELLTAEAFGHMQEVRLTPEQQRDVLDILDMWGDIQWSYDQLGEKGDITDRDVLFPGWSSGEASEHGYFARLYCYRETGEWTALEGKPDRYKMVRPSPAHDGLGMLDGYYRMLVVYRPLKEKLIKGMWRPFTLEELQSILYQYPHPTSEKGRELRQSGKLK